MSIQITFTKLADCEISTTTDLDSGIVNHDYYFKYIEDLEKLEGNGYFEKNYQDRNKCESDLMCESNYCMVSIYKHENTKSITARIYRFASYNGFLIHRVDIFCSNTLYEKFKKNNFDENLIKVNIELSEFIGDDYREKVAEAKVEQVIFDKNSKNYDEKLVEKEIGDIKLFLKDKNCMGTSGQVADICSEFAESFRQVSKNENKSDLIDAITNLISKYRSSFHGVLSAKDTDFIGSLKEKYDFNIYPNNDDFKIEFTKLTDKKDLHKAIKIFDHLWTARQVEKMFKDGYPFSVDNAQELAHEYLKLKYVGSEIIEKILIDLLVASTIAEKASSLQYNKQISVKTLLSIPIGFYKKENNSMLVDMKFKDLIILSAAFLGMHLLLKLILGLFYWWFSGLIAGDNETARIILFGLLFATDSILTYIHYLSEDKILGTDVPTKLDERNFYLIRNLCNLHGMIDSYKSSSFKNLLYQLSKDGILFPNSLYSIVK